MKKFLLLLFALATTFTIAYSDELDDTINLWNATKEVDNAYYNQKPVTDKQFDELVDKLKKPKKKWWQIFKKDMDIKPLSPVPESSEVSQFSQFNELQTVYQKIQHSPTIMISAPVETDEGVILAPGFYKLSAAKNKDGTYNLNLSQGAILCASLKAHQTNQDYNQTELNFGSANWINERCIKLIYGNIDLNLEAYLNLKD